MLRGRTKNTFNFYFTVRLIVFIVAAIASKNNMSQKPTATLVNELSDSSKFEQLNIAIAIKKEDLLSCQLHDVASGVMMVTNVSKNSLLFDKVKVGDYFLTANEKTFQNKTDLFHFAARIHRELRLKIARPKSQTAVSAPSTQSSVTSSSSIASTHSMRSSASSLSVTASTQTESSVKTPPSSAAVTKDSSSLVTPSFPFSKIIYSSQVSPSHASTKIAPMPIAPSSAQPPVSTATATSIALPSYTSPSTTQSSHSTITASPLTELKLLTKPEARPIAIINGQFTKPDREYHVWRVTSSQTDKGLGLGLKSSPLDHSVVIVSSVQPNSISATIFKPGDRVLIINGVQINDAHVCKKVILESKGDFDVCFDRPATGLLAYGIRPESLPSAQVPLPPINSSYTTPNSSIMEGMLDNPLINYETAPLDIQEIFTRQIPIMAKNSYYGSKSQRGSRHDDKLTSVRHEPDVTQHDISSDVDEILKTVSRR